MIELMRDWLGTRWFLSHLAVILASADWVLPRYRGCSVTSLRVSWFCWAVGLSRVLFETKVGLRPHHLVYSGTIPCQWCRCLQSQGHLDFTFSFFWPRNHHSYEHHQRFSSLSNSYFEIVHVRIAVAICQPKTGDAIWHYLKWPMASSSGKASSSYSTQTNQLRQSGYTSARWFAPRV